jgi:peptidoglycan hydrolase-like protein with peptidoglycan-binding domain
MKSSGIRLSVQFINSVKSSFKLLVNKKSALIIQNIAMKRILMTTGIAVLAIASVVGAQGYAFNTNLTVGSTGSDVSALQTWLIANGYHIPAVESGAAAKGYFGSQTRTAVMQYQAAKGITNTGFVGPLTRAQLNMGGGSNPGPVSNSCLPGWTSMSYQGSTFCLPPGYSAPAGSTPAPGVPSNNPTTISTPGVQGILSVTQGPVSNSTTYVGTSRVPILGIRLQAQYSDLAVQTVTLDLGSSTNIYNFVYKQLYVVDPSTNTVLATVPLNSSTVVPSGTQYIVGISGINYIVPKGSTRDLQVAADVYNSVDSTYRSTWYINLDNNGVRAVDGAGVNLYGPISGTPVVSNGGFSGGFGQGMTINQSLILNASGNLSLDSSSPLVSSVGVANVTAGTYDKLPVLVFNVNAQGDTLHIRNVTVNFNTSGSTGSVAAAYLYQGSTLVASAPISSNAAAFTSISDGTPGASIPVNTTVPFTVKVDVSNVTNSSASNIANVTASTSASLITILNSISSTASISGSAQGNLVSVIGNGPAFALSGTPAITRTTTTNTSNAATTTFTATFNVQVTAIGGNVTLGLPASSTPAFLASSTGSGGNVTATSSFSIYKNGAIDATGNYSVNAPVVTAFSQPTGTALTSNGTSFTISQGSTAVIPVTFTFQVPNPSTNTYAVQLQGVNWQDASNVAHISTFMANQPGWRTAAVGQ